MFQNEAFARKPQASGRRHQSASPLCFALYGTLKGCKEYSLG